MTSAGSVPKELTQHDIAVSNVLYGSVDFLSLQMPEIWDIAPGVGRPEIMAVHERNGHRWIVSGRAWYVLYHQELGWAMELALHSSASQQQNKPGGEESIEVNNHPAQVRRWTRQRGLFRPKQITFVEVSFFCAQSERHIRLEFSGRCPPEGFEEILKTVPYWKCH